MNKRKHEVSDELLSSLMANYKKPEDLIGENGLLKQLTKLLLEKALDAEMTEHLGHGRHAKRGVAPAQRHHATPRQMSHRCLAGVSQRSNTTSTLFRRWQHVPCAHVRGVVADVSTRHPIRVAT